MGLVFSLMALMLAQTVAHPPKPEVITNYWRYLVSVLEKEEARITEAQNAGGRRYPAPREFPFDALRNLTPPDLVRAAREGIQEARRDCAGQSPEVLERTAEANIQTALEYFPILAETDGNLNPLLNALGNEKDDPFLRRFILKRLAPGVMPPSPFSLYMQDALRHNVDKVEEILTPVIERSLDLKDLRIVALDALYAYLYSGYQYVLEQDSALCAFAQTRNVPVNAALLALPEAPKPAVEFKGRVDVCGERTKRFVELCERLLKQDEQLEPALRQHVRELLERFCADFPLIHQESARALLEQYPQEDHAG